MRLIGSGKVDEFGKVMLDKNLLKILGVKAGDGVVFAKDVGTGIRVVRDTGMDLSTEVDDYGGSLDTAIDMMKNDMTIALSTMCVALVGTVVSIVTGGIIHIGASFVALFGFLISFIAMYCVKRDINHIGQDSSPGAFVPKDGPLSEGRVIGITKIMSDTVVANCTAFMYPLFGSCPGKFSAKLVSQDGSTVPVAVDAKGESSGISEFEMRFPVSPASKDCTLSMHAIYGYNKKAIVMEADYKVSFSDDYTTVDMSQDRIDLRLSFDQNIQKYGFNTELYDPECD